MKAKKTKRANLEKQRTVFLQIGMILTLSAILFAFEWKSSVNYDAEYVIKLHGDETIVLPPITRREKEQKKVVKPLFPTEVIEFKPDDVDIIDEPFLIDENGWEGSIPVFDRPEEVVTDDPFITAEFMPTFKGQGVEYFRKYIAENVKFPTTAIEHGITGTVYASFVIDRDGSVSDVEILRKVHPVIDDAVRKVILSSPKWEPGMNNGQLVRIKFTIGISFRLE